MRSETRVLSNVWWLYPEVEEEANEKGVAVL